MMETAPNVPPAPPGLRRLFLICCNFLMFFEIAVQWMQRPQAIPGCPPGLEYLTMIDKLLAQQKKDLLEGKNLLSTCLFNIYFSIFQNSSFNWLGR